MTTPSKIESAVEHISVDIADIKVDVRDLRARLDFVHEKLDTKVDSVHDKLDAKINGVEQRLGGRIDGLSDKTDVLSDRLSKAMVWAVLLYVALAGGLLAVLARGFGWM